MKTVENPDMHVDLMFPSDYIKAVEFKGKEVTLTITKVVRDEVMTTKGKMDKYILHFKETEKMFILNKTNSKAIAKFLNEPKAVNWPGHTVTLKPMECEAFGEIVECIRVKGAK